MTPYRRRLGNLFKNILGGSGDASLAAGPDVARKGDFAFLAVLAVVVLVSIALLAWAPVDRVQNVLAALWGMTVGGALLLYLPPKVLITLVGALLGVGASDLTGLAQVVEKMSNTVVSITRTINASGPVQLQQQAVWLFLALVALCCVPAYRNENIQDTQSGGATRAAGKKISGGRQIQRPTKD